MTLVTALILFAIGLITGLLAGLFGIGGGVILVPALTAFFIWQQFDPSYLVHMALATSMSCIVFNALLSIHTHQKHRAIIWGITKKISPFVILGSALATYFVLGITGKSIALIFLTLMTLMAVQMVVGLKPQPAAAKEINPVELKLVGFIIGMLSSVIAIGGGSLTVPYLTWHQIDIKKAIATAASIGFPIALASCLMFIIQQHQQSSFPSHTIGFIYWPATLAITLGSSLSTHIGAHLTHKLPVSMLHKMFAVLIIIMAINMYLNIN